MYRDLQIAAVIPARNEERQIGAVIETMPDWVDRILVIDDASTDATSAVVEELATGDHRIWLHRHKKRRGVGGAITSGYREALARGVDVAVVLAGDGQMDPVDLPRLLDPLVDGKADYVKGNRFLYPGGTRRIPTLRKLGNFTLSVLTKLVSGYWHVSDSQCGYTAMHRRALARLELDALYTGYGYPNDLLSLLNAQQVRVAEAPVDPRYGIGEQSKMRVAWVIVPILLLLCRAYVRRLFQRYVVTDGHPLVFAFLFSFLSLAAATGLGVYILVQYLSTGWIMKAALIAGTALAILGVQLGVTALSMDQEANRALCVHLPPPHLPADPDGD